MGKFIPRRLLLVIPTLFGIMVTNLTLTQFVPGGPIGRVLRSLGVGFVAVAKWMGQRITVAVDALIWGAFTALGAAVAADVIGWDKIETIVRKAIDLAF